MQPATTLDGLLYDSTRQGGGFCLALFDTAASLTLVPTPRPGPRRNSFQNPELLVALLAETVQVT